MLTPSQVIVLAIPVFFLLIFVEWMVGWRRHHQTYRLADAISSLSLGMLSQTSAVFAKLLTIGIYSALFEHVALWRADAFWTSIPGWIIALLFYDFCYYWLHRMGHEVGILWAAHAVHHQSQHYNLTTALRQTSSGPLLAWLFFIPMALAGVPPLVFVVVGLIDLLYQYWVHTEQIRRLGWFDRWFCAPSNHRVHHAVNDVYLDKNYGGILIVWDRLFGTFKEEDDREPCVYGTRGLLNSWDPLWANAAVYNQLLHDSWHAHNWVDKLRVWLKPPGWRPADVVKRFPKPAFVLEEHRQLFDPPMTPAVKYFAAFHFVLLAGGAMAFLWHADQTALAPNLTRFATLLVAQWALGAVMQGRIGVWMALMLECGMLAAATGMEGLWSWHMVFKPAIMACAIMHVLGSARHATAPPRHWLLTALILSLAGDVFLMLGSEAFFLPGLVSFLLAHVAYLAMLRRGIPWFADHRALYVTLALGAAMYAALWIGGLPPEMRIPVAVYVTVIALMAAQAWARRHLERSLASLLMALGTGCFMLSDALLAVDRFVAPLPHAIFWVLLTYVAAQALIVQGATMRACRPKSTAQTRMA